LSCYSSYWILELYLQSSQVVKCNRDDLRDINRHDETLLIHGKKDGHLNQIVTDQGIKNLQIRFYPKHATIFIPLE
ncbi:MAG: hypothetical protein WB792_01970, partial [Desulfobacterales bacterium]